MTGIFVKRGNLGTYMHRGRKNAMWKWRQRPGWCRRSQGDRRAAWGRLPPESPEGIHSANPWFQASNLQNCKVIHFCCLSCSVVMLCYDSCRKLTVSKDGSRGRTKQTWFSTFPWNPGLTMRKLHKAVAPTQQNPGLTVKEPSPWQAGTVELSRCLLWFWKSQANERALGLSPVSSG